MNQSNTLDVTAIMPAVLASGLLVSLCTIQTPPDDFDDGGARVAAAPYQDLTGHVDIPCTAPPLSTGDHATPNEMKTMSQIEAKNQLHVLLGGWYPTIIPNYRALVDGVAYDVVGVESDSQHVMTRLAVQAVTV